MKTIIASNLFALCVDQIFTNYLENYLKRDGNGENGCVLCGNRPNADAPPQDILTAKYVVNLDIAFITLDHSIHSQLERTKTLSILMITLWCYVKNVI